MKTIPFEQVELTDGFLFDKQELNRNTTIYSVYDRFYDTGRITAFDFQWKEGDPNQPHYFWDSDVAKWIEGASYILHRHPTPELEAKIDDLVTKIQKNQGEDGYFNIYFTVVEPNERFQNRDHHELYCAGHLMEAAVAYAEATGKTDLLTCMEKYADYIAKVFIEEKSAGFFTPGHEEIELALVRMYRHTKKKKYLDMAAYFINTRGVNQSENTNGCYLQSHIPVREQTEAVGHAVRAVYLYTGMAYVAAETNDPTLLAACRTLWENIVGQKMYITGGIGSIRIGEAFTSAYDLPNDTAYAETCAAIGLIYFSQAMLAMENDAKYADVIERALYNGMLSGLSQNGKAFFYENPLEINLSERFDGTIFAGAFGKKKMARTQRAECFVCSCCPPNINRLLASLGNYLYGLENDILYVNQFVSSNFKHDAVSCVQKTDYPNNGVIRITANGVSTVALRIPGWCDSFSLNKPYQLQKGYALVENDGTDILLTLDMPPVAVFADPRVLRDVNRVAVMRGPVVYCAEGVDNGANLHRLSLALPLNSREIESGEFGLPNLEVAGYELQPFTNSLYQKQAPLQQPVSIKMIPYHAFANRGESDMLVWLFAK